MNKTLDYKLTVVVPVYNESENIERIEASFNEWFQKSSPNACVLFVNDGSTDDSLERISNVCEKNQHFYYISFAKNAGLSAAIKAGIDYTFSPLVGYIDADLQTTPLDFDLLLEYAQTYQLVIGIRANRKDTFSKRLQSKIANGFRRFMTKDGAADTGCPLKIIRTENAKRIPLFKGMHRFFPALILLQEGANYKEIPVRHFPRVAGVSKFSLFNRLVSPFMDCFAYRWMKKRAINYSVKDYYL